MKSLFYAIGLLFISQISFAQVGIGTTTPNPSTLLDLSSTTKGMRMPQMTTAQRNAIASPVAGLHILNIDDYCVDIFDGTNWIKDCGMRVTGTDTMPSFWTQRTNFGGGARAGAVSFTINNLAYMGTGTDGTYKKDLWQFNPATNAWTQRADLTGVARADAVAFSFENPILKGYVGTGFNGGYLNDFWEYNPATNLWTQKLSYPGGSRARSVGFSLIAKGYIGLGVNAGNIPVGDIYEYEQSNNSRAQKEGLLEGVNAGLESAFALPLGPTAVIGTGYFNSDIPLLDGETQNVWMFDPASGGSWTQINSFGGGIRRNAAVCGSFVGTGTQNGVLKNDLWRYSGGNWIQVLNYPGTARTDATGFTVSGKYFICGGHDGTYKNDLWEFTPYPQGNVYDMPDPPAGTHSVSDGAWTIENNKVYNSNNSNVGIGTTNPTAKLEVAGTLKVSGLVTGAMKWDNSLVNRKIVLYEAGNNDHQYFGFGINGFTLRYQTSDLSGNHVFYAASGPSASNELMRIQGNGNVGINLLNPQNKLDLNHGTGRTGSHATNLAMYVTSNSTSAGGGVEFRHENGTQGIGFGFNTIYATGSNAHQDLSFSSRGSGLLQFNTNNTERMRITGTGQIGIQQTLPTDWLHIGHMFMNGDAYISLNTIAEYKTGLRMRHGNTAWGWTVESDDVQNKFIIRRHYDLAPGTESIAIDMLTSNITLEGTIVNEATIAPTLLNSFVNYGADFAPAGYYKDKENRVHLRGLVNRAGDPDNLVIFNLPAGYRPVSGRLIITTMNNNILCRVDILTNGDVLVGAGDAGWINLTGISFRID